MPCAMTAGTSPSVRRFVQQVRAPPLDVHEPHRSQRRQGFRPGDQAGKHRVLVSDRHVAALVAEFLEVLRGLCRQRILRHLAELLQHGRVQDLLEHVKTPAPPRDATATTEFLSCSPFQMWLVAWLLSLFFAANHPRCWRAEDAFETNLFTDIQGSSFLCGFDFENLLGRVKQRRPRQGLFHLAVAW